MSTTYSDSFLRRIQFQQRVAPTIILQYDPPSRELRVWFWPVTQAGARVAPSNLLDYRVAHDFRAPCCLCACNANPIAFTESAIYLAVCGLYAGEYVAGCASGLCGYLVCLERLYPRRGLLVQKYPFRHIGTPVAKPADYTPVQTASGFPKVLPQSQSLQGHSNTLFASVATYQRPVMGSESVLDRLLRLDSWTRPGLSEPEFNRLFAKCQCGLVTTRRVFRNHICPVAEAVIWNPPEVIDLTSDDDDIFENDPSRIIIDLTADSDGGSQR